MFNTEKLKIKNWSSRIQSIGLGIFAFFTYLCFYPFRRAYTAATFDDLFYYGVQFKILMITAQVLGFAVSKAIGVKIVSEMKAKDRAKNLLIFTGLSALFMLLFGYVPPPYNLLFIFFASLPLGLFYGVILGFLEGRRNTDLLVAILTASFIIGSGFAKSIGKWIITSFEVNEFMMPFYADLMMFLPLAISVWCIAQIPVPTSDDIKDRMERLPMNKAQRKAFVNEIRLGLTLFFISYVLLTAYREFRENFMPEMLKELGYAGQTMLFTKTEIPIAISILLLMASMSWIKSHKKAFIVIQGLLLIGSLIIALSTILYQFAMINPIIWLIGVGFGSYVAYSMCNSLYFERMVSAFRYSANVGFLITLADYYAYFGSLVVLFYKNYFQQNSTTVSFFIYCSYALSVSYFLIVLGSSIYNYNKISRS